LGVRTVPVPEIPVANCFPIDWEKEDGTYACLEVTDPGCGLPEKDIDKIFDPFFTSKFAGRGLGLPVVLGIVRAHRGVVTVESEPGRGSTFRVFFPVAAESVSRPDGREISAKEVLDGNK
jgi:two-component system, cell cycle sensor histidine kinase and response regulator CckA